MRLKLAHKLFLINAGIIFALTAAFVSLSYFVSKSMYSNALNGIDLEVMEHLSEKMSEHYRQHGSWDAYLNDRGYWAATADESFFSVFFSLMAKVAGKGPQAVLEGFSPPESSQEPPKWEFPFGTFFQRLSLLDANKQTLIQAEILNADASYRKIKVKGKVVGWLRVGRINVDMLPLAQYFFDQQLNIVYWSAIFGGLVAVILSFALSRHITAPIRTLTLGAQQIARRNFRNVITIKTRDELGDLAESFNAISQELDQYQTRQKQWLMNISHELRAPLTLLVGEVFAVCDNLSKCDDTTAAFLQDQVNHVKRIADDLYQICQMDEVGFHLNRRSIDLQEFVTYQVQRYADSFAKNQLTSHEEYEPESMYVFVDSDRFGQVLSNIFENCLRYSNSPGDIWIRISRSGGDAILEVEDSGPGVPQESLPRLFERLYRIESARSRLAGGAGLGLSICKEIILAHGGVIDARAGAHGGLCIRIRLPLASEEN
jgi:two-component system sensor histidine kinase BaeS